MIWCFCGNFIPPEPPQQIKYNAVCTAYTPTVAECGKTDKITASGTYATEGRTVACDDLPLGTIIKLKNGQQYIVEDRFGAGHHNRIDIYMEDKANAIQFGKQYKEFELQGQYEVPNFIKSQIKKGVTFVC